MKRLATGEMATSEYKVWLNKRINDNIPGPSSDNAQSLEERLRMIRTEVEIIKQDFVQRSSELEKRFEQLEEENIIEEIEKKTEELEMELQNCQNHIGYLKENEERREVELYHSQNQVKDRDYLMGEAVTQVREIAEYLRTLAIQADTLSVQFETQSDRRRELASLLTRIKALGFRAKLFLWLEEKFKALENAGKHRGINANDLSLVPDLVLPYNFKMPEFEKYNGTSCSEAHITMFCRRMTGYTNNDPLLIHCFQDSLVGAAARWYNQLSRAKIDSWDDLAQAFLEQYSHITDMTPDRITLQNMKKKGNENFRQYAQRWREVAIQVQPPLLEKETTMLFICTLKAPFLMHMIRSTTRSFSDIVTIGKMIENIIKSGGIETGESAKRIPPRKKESEWYDSNAQYKYHAGITGHSIENCLAFKKLVEKFINMGVVELDDMPNVTNPLPNHAKGGVNAISESSEKRIKINVAEVRTPLRWVWKETVKHGLIIAEKSQGDRTNYCEYHQELGHEIQTCGEFRILVQNLMNNNEVEFYDEGTEDRGICALESTAKSTKVSLPMMIISHPKSDKAGTQVAPKMVIRGSTIIEDNREAPRNHVAVLEGENSASNEVGTWVTPKVTIQKPAVFAYQDSKEVPWNYECNVAVTKSSTNEKGKPAEPEPRTKEPVTEEEAKEFLKFLKNSKYCMVEQLHRQSVRIFVLALFQCSEVHRNALMKALNETYVASDISVNKLDRLIGHISADNFIHFNDDEILPGGRGSTKALHVTARCKGYILLGVLIDNGSALNVLPLSTLNRLPVDSLHMKECQSVVKAFDGTQRSVMRRIEVPLLIGPTTYDRFPGDGHRIVLQLPIGETMDTFVWGSTFIITSEGEVNSGWPIGMGLKMTVGKGALPGRGLGKHLQGRMAAPMLREKQDHFGLGFRPDARQKKKELERRKERRRARLSGKETKWKPMIISYISKTFVSGGVIHSELKTLKGEDIVAMLGNVYINSISEEAVDGEILPNIQPYKSGSILNNWTAEEIPVVFTAHSE
ncbi:hypothetical protein EPI10_029928 [Gossypium australe]|uniref:G-patch domain-containing protein n=1 Tax=Gossypium australe TaxID=47621 RepID=A0A5B6WYV9_9ROSI|nr:hypothetical protein EPI10_029928 [Gossypium australe]